MQQQIRIRRTDEFAAIGVSAVSSRKGVATPLRTARKRHYHAIGLLRSQPSNSHIMPVQPARAVSFGLAALRPDPVAESFGGFKELVGVCLC